jgi:hypothetical protein
MFTPMDEVKNGPLVCFSTLEPYHKIGVRSNVELQAALCQNIFLIIEYVNFLPWPDSPRRS